MIYKFSPLLLFVIFAFTISPTSTPKSVESSSEISSHDLIPDIDFETIYQGLNANNYQLPNKDSFSEALKGYYGWKEKGLIQNEILTLIDFGFSSTEERLWVIDMSNNTILFQSLVAHGRNSGDEFATHFSNIPESHKSSLGFYTTGETYIGKHGYSLRLDGLEKGVNDNARKRAIVMHGASYVSENFIENNGRLGRSFGCPSVPKEVSTNLIDLIKNQSCLYIYHPAKSN